MIKILMDEINKIKRFTFLRRQARKMRAVTGGCFSLISNQRRTMSKSVIHGDLVRKGGSSGATLLARAVRSTLGPSGRNVVIDPYEMAKYGRVPFSAYPKPIITKDGVSVA